LERYTDARLRAIAERGERANEMFLPLSVPPLHQQLFTRLPHSTLLLGMPAPKLQLPSIATAPVCSSTAASSPNNRG
jgi:hypothetical protein